ncbi:MAG: SUMF1/EgtB/PvdO family nonheme iron enzyme [Nitrospinaceae bacterium]|nr:formylglycine-generating enzyme family protein [Nitrospinaceae bacterium]NIR57327.1 formylglycine-generating enzyme family protein [Nitrospinaceae bacterium]NIS87779.1 formylglycine-generating enzyme family protein [Nitrospinaceae bacterium]NIT84649.1 formylglycine-generating enzyme family protein [Nitrospinaceae bacterium]NIU46828.1 formylglycine-generating enzyme family protein [Nitrospinaceae bacterium]
MKAGSKTYPFYRLIFRIFLLLFFLTLPVASLTAAAPQAPPGMVYVPEGYFPMGLSSSTEDDQKPEHFVYTSAFFIDKYEVSNAEYTKFINATGYAKPKYWEDDRFNQPNQPVVGVSWFDAMAYARWKGRRLPTEAEWEKAARGNDGRPYPWGEKWAKGFKLYFVNVYGTEDKFEFTAPVNYYGGGASPFGALNMAGNVWEWCLDWYDEKYYQVSPELNPEGPEARQMKVLRGGSWINNIDGVRVTNRSRNFPETRNNIYGFRTLLPLK